MKLVIPNGCGRTRSVSGADNRFLLFLRYIIIEDKGLAAAHDLVTTLVTRDSHHRPFCGYNPSSVIRRVQAPSAQFAEGHWRTL
jgi:hypothetical protein